MTIRQYICNYNAMPHLENCLNSIDSSLPTFIYDNASIDMSVEYLKTQQNKFKNIELSTKNVGKALAINNMVRADNNMNIIDDDDLIFSIDSDLTIQKPDEFYPLMNKVWNTFKDKISCIATWQIGHNVFTRNIEWTQHPDGFHYYMPLLNGDGIPGGAISIPYKYWKIFNGYRENTGYNRKSTIYGGEDGYLLVDLYDKIKLPICVIKELVVYHPYEDNIDYAKWKIKMCNEINIHGHTVTSGEYFNTEFNNV